jgi:uncharacterized 2Fe-2S/4Fe-4S cluster protein (DUF4445 family)
MVANYTCANDYFYRNFRTLQILQKNLFEVADSIEREKSKKVGNACDCHSTKLIIKNVLQLKSNKIFAQVLYNSNQIVT